MCTSSFNPHQTQPDPQSHHHHHHQADRKQGHYHPPHGHEDWKRDLPQALLFPHSLDTAAPGRQVLLRHQRVLFAQPPPTPPPSAADEMDGMVQQGGEGGGEYSPAESSMGAKVERLKVKWIGMCMLFFPLGLP
ncbi:hypothetical protein F4804DRAFT_286624 [Jackrogersella minutella]|nr:hypothetical protein F4804DRAFT_286624 [Jackrogersella minutella]